MEQQTSDIELIRKRIDDTNDILWNQRGARDADDEMSKEIEGIFAEAKNINYNYGIARSTLSLAMRAFVIKNDFDLALNYLSDALENFKELNDEKWVANTLLTLAIVKNSAGAPESALYFALKGIEFFEKNAGDPKDVTMAYYVIGTVHKDLKLLDKAESYYKKGIVNEKLDDMWNARVYAGLSNIYNLKGEFSRALDLGLKSHSILKSIGNKVGESRALNDIGIIYRKLKNYDLALDYFFQGYKIRKDGNYLHIVLGSLIEIADTYLEINNNEKALEYLLLAEPIAKDTNHVTRLASILQRIASLYKITKNYPESITYYEKFITLNSEINSKERETKINSLQNALLQEKEQEIERLKNIELKNAYDLISEKNKEIMDSIHYAKRIQNALLASSELLQTNLKEHFVLFKPKDIVSGDFYWATKAENRFYLAVCDSTGHGVPGAFMSLLNITFLNEAINEKDISEPHLILNYVRERLISTISQDGAQDGMDGTLVCFELPSNKTGEVKITYAAANNAPVLIYGDEILNLPSDKMPVGKGMQTNSFTLNCIDAKAPANIYLITDGYADQFGGIKGKKFKYKQLIEVIKSHSTKTLKEQKEILTNTFDNWMGNLEQVDDVCMIGIKL